MAGQRDVVEAGHRDLAGHADAVLAQRRHDAERGLVVGARDRAGQFAARGEQPVDHLGAARGEVVALPFRSVLQRRAGRDRLGCEHLAALEAVRAVGVAAEVGDRRVAVVAEQVPGQGLHARLVVAVHVGGGGGGVPGQRDDRQLPRQPVHLVGLEHPVVQDEPVALAGQRQRPAAGVVLVDAHRPDQQVEAAALRRRLDTAVDQVGILQALRLGREQVLVQVHPPRPAHDHADDFLEPRAQRPRRPVRREAELGHGRQHAVPGFLPRVALPVEHAGDRGDGHARGPGHVIDRRRSARATRRVIAAAVAPGGVPVGAVSRVPACPVHRCSSSPPPSGWRGKRLPEWPE